MGKVDEILEILKENTGLNHKKEEKNDSPILWILAIVGGVVAIAAIAYAVYRYFTPECFEDDFEDEFEDDDFDDDYFEDDDEVIEVKYSDNAAEETEEDVEE